MVKHARVCLLSVPNISEGEKLRGNLRDVFSIEDRANGERNTRVYKTVKSVDKHKTDVQL